MRVAGTLRLVLPLVALVAALPAQALELPISGVYADAAGCAYLAGDTDQEVFLILRPDSVEQLDAVCPIAEVDGEGETITAIHAACHEGSDNWVASYLFAPAEGDGYVLTPFDTNTGRTLRPCD